MSSTTGVQNLLVNVFRPVYKYEIPTGGSTPIFVPKLELSNVDTYSGNTISVFRADVGDANSNVYVGSNAGNPYTVLNACRFVSAFGHSAGVGISNVSNSVFLGYNAGAGATDANSNVAVGVNANGNGVSNVYVGAGTGGGGNSNVFLGAGTVGSGSRSILIGTGLTDASSSDVFKLGQGYLTGNISTKWLGIGTPTPSDPSNKLDVSGNLYVLGQVGINIGPGERTMDVNGNFRASDAFGTLDFSNGVTSSLNGFASIRGSTIVANGDVVPIAPLKIGLAMIAVRSGSAEFDGRTSFILDVATPIVSNLSSNKTGSTTVTFSSGNINIYNTSGGDLTYTWSVTYFPVS